MIRAWLIVFSVVFVNPVLAEEDGSTERAFFGDALLTLSAEGVVGSRVDATLEVNVASRLEPGDQLVITQHWSDDTRLQVDAPQQYSYVSVLQTLPLTPGYSAMEGTWGGLDSPADVVTFTVTDPGIDAGTLIRFSVNRLVLPSHASEAYQLPVFIVTPSDSYRLPANTVSLLPGQLQSIRLVSDSVVHPADDINLRIELVDAFGNRVADRDITLDLLINGTFRQRIDMTAAFMRVPDVRFDVPGTYQLEVRSGGGGLRAVSNPVSVAPARGKILWMDIGRTSMLSDGQFQPEQLALAGSEFDLVIPADHGEAWLPGSDQIQARRASNSISEGESLLVRAADGRELTIALAEQPTDLRFETPRSLRLVEVVTAGSVHHWLSERALAHGYRVGFVGSNHSHQYPGQHPPVYSALQIDEGEDWFTALAGGNTYVSVGSKIILDTGRELPMEEIRNPFVSIIADAPIVAVTAYKNGRVFRQLVGGEPDGDHVGLEVESPSEPFSPFRSRPRNAREWIGYLAVREGQILGTDQDVSGWKFSSGDVKRRLDFYTRSHGLPRLLPFYLDSDNPDTVIEISLADGLEDAAWLPKDRLPQPLPAKRFMISLEELDEGASRTVEVAGYTDRISVRRLPTLKNEGNFSFSDPSPPRFGDSYHFVIRLLNGSFAISSPIYVNDHASN